MHSPSECRLNSYQSHYSVDRSLPCGVLCAHESWVLLIFFSKEADLMLPIWVKMKAKVEGVLVIHPGYTSGKSWSQNFGLSGHIQISNILYSITISHQECLTVSNILRPNHICQLYPLWEVVYILLKSPALICSSENSTVRPSLGWEVSEPELPLKDKYFLVKSGNVGLVRWLSG